MRRLRGQPQAVQELAWKTQLRLCGRYRKLRARGKPHQTIITHNGHCKPKRDLCRVLKDNAERAPPVKPAVLKSFSSVDKRKVKAS